MSRKSRVMEMRSKTRASNDSDATSFSPLFTQVNHSRRYCSQGCSHRLGFTTSSSSSSSGHDLGFSSSLSSWPTNDRINFSPSALPALSSTSRLHLQRPLQRLSSPSNQLGCERKRQRIQLSRDVASSSVEAQGIEERVDADSQAALLPQG